MDPHFEALSFARTLPVQLVRQVLTHPLGIAEDERLTRLSWEMGQLYSDGWMRVMSHCK